MYRVLYDNTVTNKRTDGQTDGRTDDPDDRLGARLLASWEAVNDDDDDDGDGEDEDEGESGGRGEGRLWVVDFKSVTVKLFGFELFTKRFEDTTRVWDQTYVDGDTR